MEVFTSDKAVMVGSLRICDANANRLLPGQKGSYQNK